MTEEISLDEKSLLSFRVSHGVGLVLVRVLPYMTSTVFWFFYPSPPFSATSTELRYKVGPRLRELAPWPDGARRRDHKT